MSVSEILTSVKSNPYIVLNKEELDIFLACSTKIKEVDTCLSDFVRILKYNDEIFFQEVSDKNEILLRKMNSLEDAEKLLKERMDFYERKWDGCGCKINYYD
ncbi:MAG: hypothetical protein N3D80_01910 [Ignavibacterium album]|jgi:hypothetical protein|uniref:Uncharacterized protein n=1 Tax=Ignavibacterium album TaxID=591197 RepID=A0A7V2ZLM2_9BACT|nr:hypothetical protein [Ignavibacterium album]MCX8104611.1 hypothetical protein [Ignavibacterium album]